nr:hypothetical protein CFP56_28547 [Quercus suber]
MTLRSATITVCIAALACVVQATVAGIQTRLTVSILPNTNIYGMALVASVLDIISLPVLAAGIVFRLRHMHHPIVLPFHLVSAAILVSASVLTIYCLVWIERHFSENVNVSASRSLVEAGIGLSGVSLIMIAAFNALIFCSKPVQSEGSGVELGQQRYQPMKSVVGSSLASLTSTPFFTRSVGTSTNSHASPSSRSSFRYSLVSALRPISFRSIPSIRGSYASSETKSTHATLPISIVAVRDDDEFHNWVSTTDGAFASLEKSNTRAPKTSKLETPRLATIAGSRPVSPANTIRKHSDISRSGREDSSLNVSSLLLPSSHSQLSLPASAAPLKLKASKSESSLRSVHPLAPEKSRSHIHPLFRSGSAGSLPIASPGTIITASPMAGQVVRQKSVRLVSAKDSQ